MNRLITIIKTTFVIGLAFILSLGIGYWRAINQQAELGQTTQFEVKAGEGPRVIADNLANAKLINNDKAFLLYVILNRKSNSFYPGTYELPNQSTIKSIVSTLTNSEQKHITLRILEGWRIKDIAEEVAKKTNVSAQEFEAAAPVEQYEGYLFPDTYYVAEDVTASGIVRLMRDNFDKRTKDLSLTAEDVIMASIVEREAKVDADRYKVAGVYTNRFKAGIALDADPTVQYAKGSWDPIVLSDYRSTISPYNTYLNKGLPPTPISNPGLAALKAAKSPAQHDYIFFFHDSKGATYYSKTLEEHNANKRLYLK